MKKKQFTFKQLLIRKMPHNLITLLIANNLFEAYIKNTVKEYKDCEFNVLYRGCPNSSAKEYINMGFYWHNTPEGYEVWCEMYEKAEDLDKIKQL